MAGLHEEDFLELSLDDIKSSCGFGLDIGGTIAKLAYRSKEDFKNGEPIRKDSKQSYGHLRLKGFPRDKLDEVLDFICENCDLTRDADGDGLVQIHTTGFGGNQIKKQIEEKFNANVKNEAEFDLFVKAFRKLVMSLERKQVLLPESKEGIEIASRQLERFTTFKEGIKEHSEGKLGFGEAEIKDINRNDDKEADNTKGESMLPCLLITCGSGVGMIKVEKDGKFGLVDGVPGGGRMFLGLSNLLTGIKNFDELMEMVAKGDGATTDIFSRHMKSKDSNDFYGAMDDDVLIYAFGQGTTKSRDECKKEDMVFSLMNYLLMDLTHIVLLNSNLLNVPRAYFCGNFVNHDIPRKIITTLFTVRNAFNLNQQTPCDFGFIKHGGFLGAIGAYLAGKHDVNRNIKKET